MKLLCEVVEEVQFIKEETGDKKKFYFIEGVFLQSGIKNRNGRIYPSSIMEAEVANYTKNFIAQNRAVGELNHPNSPTINYDRASHKILSLRKEGNNFIGKAKIMNTPMGKITQTLLDEGINLGVSSRALGSVKMNSVGINEVQSDFRLSTAADIVHDPSAPDAFVQSIMESVDWVLGDDGSWHKQIAIVEETKDLIMRNKDAPQEVKNRIFALQMEKFVGGLKV